MMKKFNKIFSIFLILIFILSLCACSSSYSKSEYKGAGVADEAYYDTNHEYARDESEYTTSDNSKDLFVHSDNENQKLIYTGKVAIGTDDLKQSYDDIVEKLKQFDAKFESIDESGSYKSMTIRVSSDKFMDLYNSLGDVAGTITSSNISVDDLTKQYVDNERKIDILTTEYNELKELMQQADNVEDIIMIRDRMSDINYELEQYQNMNSNIDYDANNATLIITLQLNYKDRTQPQSFGSQVKEAFKDSIDALKGFALGVITLWWFILLLIAIVVFIILMVKHSRKKKLKAKHLLPNGSPDPQYWQVHYKDNKKDDSNNQEPANDNNVVSNNQTDNS